MVFRLRVLGSGDAFNAAGALHSAYFVEHDGGKLLMECGPCVLAGMKRHGVAADAPDAVLISHLHGDHFGGLPFLFLEYTFCTPRDRPLEVAGPEGIEERVETLHAALYKEAGCRCLDFGVRFRTVRPGDQLELAGFSVEAFEVPHPAEPYSLGFRVSGSDATLLFSGDSAWTEEFVSRSQGTDLFLCECCSLEPASNVHINYREILEHRARLGCKRLLLTHLGDDVRARDDLEVETASDGMLIELP